LKEWIVERYNDTDAAAADSVPTGTNNEQKYGSRQVRRRVIVTRSRGRHTRLSEGPASADFAEAFLDWWLLGECDVVIKNMLSFADTAALRTATPLYDGDAFLPLFAEDANATAT